MTLLPGGSEYFRPRTQSTGISTLSGSNREDRITSYTISSYLSLLLETPHRRHETFVGLSMSPPEGFLPW